ncbi:hypothetical protein EVAR_99597_1 [Eumeta japonica]|uniref:Uncharacterized protein n=1 Tax=Eumeta variegata TaxID=151549 RepID=A0A4C2A0B5_EUMVA|nr:hypothetical protein EVAR_99597_1 [Eumeta japonica]
MIPCGDVCSLPTRLENVRIDASQAQRLGRSCLSIVLRSRSHARLRRNAIMSHAFSCVQPAFVDDITSKANIKSYEDNRESSGGAAVTAGGVRITMRLFAGIPPIVTESNERKSAGITVSPPRLRRAPAALRISTLGTLVQLPAPGRGGSCYGYGSTGPTRGRAAEGGSRPRGAPRNGKLAEAVRPGADTGGGAAPLCACLLPPSRHAVPYGAGPCARAPLCASSMRALILRFGMHGRAPRSDPPIYVLVIYLSNNFSSVFMQRRWKLHARDATSRTSGPLASRSPIAASGAIRETEMWKSWRIRGARGAAENGRLECGRRRRSKRDKTNSLFFEALASETCAPVGRARRAPAVARGSNEPTPAGRRLPRGARAPPRINPLNWNTTINPFRGSYSSCTPLITGSVLRSNPSVTGPADLEQGSVPYWNSKREKGRYGDRTWVVKVRSVKCNVHAVAAAPAHRRDASATGLEPRSRATHPKNSAALEAL